MKNKTVLLTGGAGGLGSATTHYLAKKGWHVFVADFDADLLAKLEGLENISTVQIDVTNTNSVEKAVAEVAKQTDGLDAVINCAGILALGSMIEIDEAVLQRVIDVNFFGTYRVNKACFELLKNRRGRIVNISSETGWQSGAPFNGAYASSKHAIEAYSDSLRRELSFHKIPVIKVQPGPFKTDMVASIKANFDRAVDQSVYFKKILKKMSRMAVKTSQHGQEPEYLAKVLYQILKSSKPKAAYSIKPDPMRSALEYLPTKTADLLLKKALQV